jgi:hypothetical protein
MQLKVGERLACGDCGVQVIVVRTAAGDVDVTCDGRALDGIDGAAASKGAADAAAGTQLGKRYVDEKSGLELLCTSSGAGTLEAAGAPMQLKAAKVLPSSD